VMATRGDSQAFAASDLDYMLRPCLVEMMTLSRGRPRPVDSATRTSPSNPGTEVGSLLR